MRCFIAIEFPDALRRRLADLQQQLSQLDWAVRWTDPQHIHLTVKFLGEVRDADVTGVCRAVAAAAAECSPFELQIRGTGCFPPRGPERIVWAGVVGPPQELLACHRSIEQACAELGFPPEDRAYSPHLTIGRVRQPDRRLNIRSAVGQHEGFTTTPFEVSELVIFQSILGPGGAKYVPLARAALGDGDQPAPRTLRTEN